MRRWIALTLAALAVFVCLFAAGSPTGPGAAAAAETEAGTEPAEETNPAAESDPAAEPEEPWPGYTDVSGHWAEREILYLHEIGLMDGMAEGIFAPGVTMTRAMFVVVLHRLHVLRTGQAAELPAQTPFLDVPANAWYAEGVAWAWQAGIVEGVTEDRFMPSSPCTREQSVVLVRRYLTFLGLPTGQSAWLGSFRDAYRLSLYARGAMSWAVGAGLIQGTDLYELSPRGSLTRAQFAMIAVRLLDYLDGTLPEPELTPRPEDPQADAVRVEVDHTPAGPGFTSGVTRYLSVNALVSALGGSREEESAEGVRLLRLRLLGQEAVFYDGFNDARITGVGQKTFSGAVLRASDGWYLPAAAMKAVWSREPIYDRGEELIRCLSVSSGVRIAVNASALPDSLTCDGVPVLSAARLAAAAGGSVSVDVDQRGVRYLTLTALGHTMRFPDGATSAQADGGALTLPVPAWQSGETWYIPAELIGGVLGYTVVRDEPNNRVDLFRPVSSAELWFGGMYLGKCRAVGDVPCDTLSRLLPAVGGSSQTSGKTVTVSALGHTVVFTEGSASAKADGAAVLLPIPVIISGGEWLVPLRPLAEALGMTELSAGSQKLVFSSIKTCTTVLWVDGGKCPACYLHDGVRYVRLNDAAGFSGGSLKPNGSKATFAAWGKTASLTCGSNTAWVNGKSVSLPGPALADGDVWYAPASALLQAMGLSELEDASWNQVFYTRVVKNTEIASGYRVPVLMYHAVSDNIWGIPELFVSPANMEAQLKAIVDGGYTAITFEDLDHIASIQKPVLLTFDDGYLDNYTELFPLLKKYNVKATFFIIVDAIGNSRSMTKAQLKELSDSGLVSIQSHTMSHGYLDEMNATQLQHEFYDSQLALARITGKQPFVLCYPSGRNSALARTWAAKYYQYGLCMGGSCYVTGSAPFLIYRYYVSRYTSLATFKSYLG